MSEIEIKILEINRAQVEHKLQDIGARMIFDGEIHAIYYDLPDNSLNKNDKTLRLRKEGQDTALTVKIHVPNDKAKERIEHETRASDFETMRTILESIGFIPWLEMKKHRTSYELNGLHFELDHYQDEYSYIPEFLEIEGTDTETLYKYAETLGFSRQDCRSWDAVELASFYEEKKNVM